MKLKYLSTMFVILSSLTVSIPAMAMEDVTLSSSQEQMSVDQLTSKIKDIFSNNLSDDTIAKLIKCARTSLGEEVNPTAITEEEQDIVYPFQSVVKVLEYILGAMQTTKLLQLCENSYPQIKKLENNQIKAICKQIFNAATYLIAEQIANSFGIPNDALEARVYLSKENSTKAIAKILNVNSITSEVATYIKKHLYLIKNNKIEQTIADYLGLHGIHELADLPDQINLQSKDITSLDGIKMLDNIIQNICDNDTTTTTSAKPNNFKLDIIENYIEGDGNAALPISNNEELIKPISYNRTISLNLAKNFILSSDLDLDMPKAPFDLAIFNNLQHIDLSNNQLYVITEDLLQMHCPIIFNHINLSHNIIVDLPKELFSKFKGSIIDLSHNKIEQITNNIFSNCIRVQELYLNNNGIKSISATAFAGQDGLARKNTINAHNYLRLIDLGHNHLTTIENGTLNVIPTLSTLNLSNNDFSEFPMALQYQDNLLELNLSHNNISQLPIAAFTAPNITDGLKTAIQENIANDNIAKDAMILGAKAGCFITKHILNNVNQIGWCIPVRTNGQLQFGPFREETGFGIFQMLKPGCGLTMLRKLDLSHNDIQEIPEGIFNELAFLSTGNKDLILTGNQKIDEYCNNLITEFEKDANNSYEGGSDDENINKESHLKQAKQHLVKGLCEIITFSPDSQTNDESAATNSNDSSASSSFSSLYTMFNSATTAITNLASSLVSSINETTNPINSTDAESNDNNN